MVLLSMSHNEYITYKKEIVDSFSWKNSTILDLGCSGGEITKSLVKDNRVIGIDNNSDVIDKAKTCGLEAICFDLNMNVKIPLDDESVDTVLALDVLEHLFDPEICINDLLRIIKPNGLLVFSVPNSTNIFNRLSFLCGSLRDITDDKRDDLLFSSHKNGFNQSVIRKIAQKYNLTTTQIKLFIPTSHEEKDHYIKNFVYTILLKVLYYSFIAKFFRSLFTVNYIAVFEKMKNTKS